MASFQLLTATFLLCATGASAFFNRCPPCKFVTCKPVYCEESLQQLDPVCGCCPVCLSGEYGRCGGSSNVQCADGLLCRYRLGNILGEERTGQCETTMCRRKTCGYRQYCDAQVEGDRHRIICRCHRFYRQCEGKHNPVCGNNGITYQSVCHLRKTECYSGVFIGWSHMGQCREYNIATQPVPVTVATKPPKPNKNSLEDDDSKKTEEDDDLLFQEIMFPEQEINTAAPSRSCLFNGKTYQPGTITSFPKDSCRYIVCNAYNVISIVPVPGCPGHPPDIDPGIGRRPVAGGWTEWSEWTDCNGGCYNSTTSRYRTCTRPRPKYEGRYCEGPAVETVKCFPKRCNIACNYTRWSGWSECSVTCGGGITTRTRTITNEQDEEVTRKACDLVETKGCGHRNCPVSTGPCRRRSLGTSLENLDHLPLMRWGYHCRTTQKFEVKYCGGTCDGGNGTACCQPTEYRYKRRKQIDCGHIVYYESDVPVVSKCECVGDQCGTSEGSGSGEGGL